MIVSTLWLTHVDSIEVKTYNYVHIYMIYIYISGIYINDIYILYISYSQCHYIYGIPVGSTPTSVGTRRDAGSVSARRFVEAAAIGH